jgi:hypothetical protein
MWVFAFLEGNLDSSWASRVELSVLERGRQTLYNSLLHNSQSLSTYVGFDVPVAILTHGHPTNILASLRG